MASSQTKPIMSVAVDMQVKYSEVKIHFDLTMVSLVISYSLLYSRTAIHFAYKGKAFCNGIICRFFLFMVDHFAAKGHAGSCIAHCCMLQYGCSVLKKPCLKKQRWGLT